jgi:hypothetical protein
MIDQMRLRRATNLPVESQNFLSSGSQFAIQVGFVLLIENFLSDASFQCDPGRCRLLVVPLASLPFTAAQKEKAAALKCAFAHFLRTAALLSAHRTTLGTSKAPVDQFIAIIVPGRTPPKMVHLSAG